MKKKSKKCNPVGPGYHDITLDYKLDDAPFKQKVLNVRANSRDQAVQKSIKAMEAVIGKRIEVTGISAKSGISQYPNPKGNKEKDRQLAEVIKILNEKFGGKGEKEVVDYNVVDDNEVELKHIDKTVKTIIPVKTLTRIWNIVEEGEDNISRPFHPKELK